MCLLSQQAAEEAEQRGTVAKAAAKPEGTLVVTVAEVTNEELTEGPGHRRAGENLGLQGGRSLTAESHSPVAPSESRVSSGLSASSESLTDVSVDVMVVSTLGNGGRGRTMNIMHGVRHFESEVAPIIVLPSNL